MLEIEAHRSVLGRFYTVSFKLSSGHIRTNKQKNYQALTVFAKSSVFQV